MAETTRIEWTDATWNLITGCTMVSAGCTNCYAMGLAATRMRAHPSRAGLTRMTGGRPVWTGEVRFNEQWLDKPLRWRHPRRIFVCAHGDLFHEAVPDDWIDRVFAVMALAPRHTFQVLTKRPERMSAYMAGCGPAGATDILSRAGGRLLRAAEYATRNTPRLEYNFNRRWPLPNVCLGTSIEDQATADARIPHLLATPAAVRFVSAEPLLGALRLDRVGPSAPGGWVTDALRGHRWPDLDEGSAITSHTECLDWVIVGGESGHGARPMHPNWARSLRDQCQAAEVPFFFKQWGEWAPMGRLLDDAKLSSDTPRTLILNEAGNRRGRGAGSLTNSLCEFSDRSHCEVMEPVGKTRAGRLLDGREWNEMPRTPG